MLLLFSRGDEERLAPICLCVFLSQEELGLRDLVKCYTWLERRYCLGPSMIPAHCFLLLLLGGGFYHHAPFAFLIMLQMCLMAVQSLCTERGALEGIQEACLCELSLKKK